MPIETTLLRNGRVLFLRYTDPFDAAETLANTQRLIREVYIPAPKPIYSISDFTLLTQIRLSMLSDGLKVLRRSMPNSAMLVLVTNSPVANGIARTLAQVLSDQKVFSYRSLNDAWDTVDALLAAEDNAAHLTP